MTGASRAEAPKADEPPELQFSELFQNVSPIILIVYVLLKADELSTLTYLKAIEYQEILVCLQTPYPV